MDTIKKIKPRLGPVTHIILFLVAIVLLLGQISREAPREDLRRLQFYGEYSYDGITWTPFQRQKLSSLDGDLFLRGDFGMQFPENSILTFHAFHIGLRMELNGEVLVSTEDMSCSSRWISVEIPEYVDGDDRFTIRLSNDHILGNAHSYDRLLNGIYYGSVSSVRQVAEDQSSIRQTVGITVIALSVALMGMALVFGVMGVKADTRMVPIGMMALCYGGYLILTAPVTSFGTNQPDLLSGGLFLCIIAALMELGVLLRSYLTDFRRKTAGVLLSMQLLWLLLLLVGELLGKITMCRLLDLWIPPQIGAMGVLLILGVWEWIFCSDRNPGVLLFCGLLFAAALSEAVNEFLLLWWERIVLDVVVALFFYAYAVYGIVSIPLSIRKAARAERLQSDLEQSRIVLALSQIRAHFIFNILNAISGMCKYDPEKADVTLIRFARYLRGNINVMQEDRTESFSTSLAHLQDYIALEQVRFGDRIRFRAETPVTNFRLPPLILQPLVENAIKHGLNPKKEGGTITLRTEQKGDRIYITISDDGVGFCVSDPVREGAVGMNNVRFRLKELLGGELQVESTPGKGTCVTVSFSVDRVRL